MDDNKILFEYIKNHEWTKFIDLLKKKENIDINIRDSNYNYLIQYVVMFNKKDVATFLINKGCKLDIIDTDGRSILFNPIKYNYIDILKLLLHFNNSIIGISLIDIRDNYGLTALYYSILFNNIKAFDILIENGSKLTIKDKKTNDAIHLAVKYQRIELLKKILKLDINVNSINTNGETALHVACNYNYTNIAILLIDSGSDINIQDYKQKATPLLYTIIQNNFDLIELLILKKADINLQDYYGNTALHLAIIEKTKRSISILLENSDINYNLVNLDGNTALHIALEEYEMNMIEQDYFIKLVKNTNINIQNNFGNTCLYYLINKQIWSASNILEKKKCNFFIRNNNNEIILDIYPKKSSEYNKVISIAINSYYNLIQNENKDWKNKWENLCNANKNNSLQELKKMFKSKNEQSHEIICKQIIEEYIINENISIPLQINYHNITIDYGIMVDHCTYTGSTIDVIFGLLFLKQQFSFLGTSLSNNIQSNNKVEEYYESLGIASNYKIEFLNFEILWIYQKLLYPDNYDKIIEEHLINKAIQYIVIPIGIELDNGSHANILLWDIKNNEVERFEPNGSIPPYQLNYNAKLLDQLLKNKFTCFNKKLKYFSPEIFLPSISFQQFEIKENKSCSKIGDPNGFCAIWCNWWIDMRLKYKTISRERLVYKLFKKIREDNISFKDLIRNYSKHITDLRDQTLKKADMDINDWLNDQYSEETFNKLIKEINTVYHS